MVNYDKIYERLKNFPHMKTLWKTKDLVFESIFNAKYNFTSKDSAPPSSLPNWSSFCWTNDNSGENFETCIKWWWKKNFWWFRWQFWLFPYQRKLTEYVAECAQALKSDQEGRRFESQIMGKALKSSGPENTSKRCHDISSCTIPEVTIISWILTELLIQNSNLKVKQ